MSWDKLEGSWLQLKGDVKERWGELTDDDIDEIDGRRDRLAGKLQEKYGYAKERVEQELTEFINGLRARF